MPVAVVELTFVGAFELSLSRPFSLPLAATISIETLGDVGSGPDGGLGYAGVFGDVAGSHGIAITLINVLVLGLRLVRTFKAKGRLGGAGRYIW